MLSKIKAVFRSPKLLYLVLAIFLAQAIYFATVIKWGIPSDEPYHYEYIEYYAERPITAGPIISHQEGHFNLGDVQRNPSYFYHYAFSFYFKSISHFTDSRDTRLLLLRLANIGLGLLTLLILVRLFSRAGIPTIVTNLVLLGLVLTGKFIWTFSAINYDNLAIPLFLLFLLSLLSFMQKQRFEPLLASTAIAMVLLITKHTYAPVVVFSYLTVIALGSKDFRTISNSVKKSFKAGKSTIYLLVLLNIVFGGLFLERFAINYIDYHSSSPACIKLHTAAECAQDSSYNRNVQQKATFDGFKRNGGKLNFSLPNFTGNWLGNMYRKLYLYYWGHNQIYPTKFAKLTAIGTAVVALASVLLKLRQIMKNKALKLIAAITVFYIVLLFLYNMHTYLSLGETYGFQGRYLLPVLPFVYLIVILAIRLIYKELPKPMRVPFALFFIGLIGLNIYLHASVLTYIRGV